MIKKSKTNIVSGVFNKIVKFYCGLGAHFLNQLKFQPYVPINSVESEQASLSVNVDSQKLNN